MNTQNKKKIATVVQHSGLALLSLCAGSIQAATCCAGNVPGISPYFAIRSQGRDKTIQMAGMTNHTFNHIYDDCGRGTFAITPEYTRTFRPQKIADCLFGAQSLIRSGNSCGTNSNSCGQGACCDNRCDNDCDRRCILIQGSQVEDRCDNAWLADYFYLPTDYQSKICFEPRIQNFLLNLDLFVSLNDCICGTYVRFYTPFVWSKWDLNFCEEICATGTHDHAAGYFNIEGIERADLLASFECYANGGAPNVDNIIFNPLSAARINNCDRTNTAFADFRMEIGWDFWHEECHNLGANVQMAAPTGTRPRGCRLFEPVIGNGHHWELGAGLFGHRDLWTSCDENWCSGFYFDLNLTHMFATRQRRTFDLCGKQNSRYMLAEKLAKPVENGLVGSPLSSGEAPTPADFQFKSAYTPVANLTTIDVNVSAAIQTDFVAMLNVTGCCWSFDLGYNFWMRSCEHISLNPQRNQKNCNFANLCNSKSDKMWALKGDAHVFGFTQENDSRAVALSATQSQATINCGTNAGTTEPVDPHRQNFGVDHPQFAFSDFGTLFSEPNGNNQIKTSIQPIFISCEDLDFQAQRGLSHKVFANAEYIWWDCECYIPYLGIGGYAEFGKNESNKNTCAPVKQGSTSTNNSSNGITTCNTNCCSPCCDLCSDCISCSLSQWALWLKGGVSF